ncbi:MAG: peptidoglycan editing factor PgeF [Chloroherpetonaceae bacterium]|nr:peptidoglycan editing factor PgeF [Chloroherpetonaceae bacterium]
MQCSNFRKVNVCYGNMQQVGLVPNGQCFLVPSIFASEPDVLAAQSLRLGGVSEAPFDSLNLGLSSGDRQEHVLHNREIFYASLGVPPSRVVLAHQTHSDHILRVDAPGRYSDFDALITNQRNLFLTVSVADCTPILIYDRAHKAIGAVHAGWRGTAQRILYKTLLAMQEAFDTRAKDCIAYIGTCISAESYAVDADVAQYFESTFKVYDSVSRKFFLDLKAANLHQLYDFGFERAQVEISPYCSYRRPPILLFISACCARD